MDKDDPMLIAWQMIFTYMLSWLSCNICDIPAGLNIISVFESLHCGCLISSIFTRSVLTKGEGVQ